MRQTTTTPLRALRATACALAAFGTIAFHACTGVPRAARATGERSLYAIESASIGGGIQYFSIRSMDTRNPVLLFLHGGPGGASMTILRRFNAKLEERFTVVAWDQRGAGKSYHAGDDPATMNLDRMIGDAAELTALLKERFGKRKIFLMGHSWGSILGVELVSRYPENYHAYIGTGQVADMARGEQASYSFTLDAARARGDGAAVERLVAMGMPVDGVYAGGGRDLEYQRTKMVRYGGAVYGKSSYYDIVTSTLLGAQEYSLGDKFMFLKGLSRSNELLWPQVLKTDFFQSAAELKIPVALMLGRHDYNTPSAIAAAWLEALVAPHKTLVWFEKSAHNPQWEEPERFHGEVFAWLDRLEAAGFLSAGD